MTIRDKTPAERTPAVLRTVDIAGTAWPLYKLEAIAVGVFLLFATLAVGASLQAGVLTAAASTVVVWWMVRAVECHAER